MIADNADWCPVCETAIYVGTPVTQTRLGLAHVGCVGGKR